MFRCFDFFAPERKVKAPPHPDELMFMNCVIKIDKLQKGWHRKQAKILMYIQERSRKDEQEGTMIKTEISGKCKPADLIKAIAKNKKVAKLCSLEYGNCSSRLNPAPAPPPPPAPIPPASYNYEAAEDAAGSGATSGANDQAARSGRNGKRDKKQKFHS